MVVERTAGLSEPKEMDQEGRSQGVEGTQQGLPETEVAAESEACQGAMEGDAEGRREREEDMVEKAAEDDQLPEEYSRVRGDHK